VAIPPYLKEGKISQFADVLGRPLPHHYPDQSRHIPDSAPFQGKNDGRPPRQTGAVAGGYSGRVALRRGQSNMTLLLLAAWLPARFVMSCLQDAHKMKLDRTKKTKGQRSCVGTGAVCECD